MLPDDDWQGVVFKKVKDQFKERRRFKEDWCYSLQVEQEMRVIEKQ